MSYPLVPLSEILVVRRDPVAVQSTETYRTAGVYSFGKGLFERPTIDGSETSYTTYFRLRENQFVYSRLFAWEGAVAIVDETFDGIFVSQEFPTFDIDPERALPQYLAAVCRWPDFHHALSSVTKGLGLRRQRVHPEQLLQVKIPLPGIHEQSRVAGRVDSLLVRTSELVRLGQVTAPARMVEAGPSLVERTLSKHTSGMRPLEELVEFVNDLVRPGDDPAPAHVFVGLQHIESHTGRRTGDLPLGDEKGRKFRFRPGDVLYGYLRPYLNKVWLADLNGLCSVEQYVLRSRGEVPAEFIAHALRSASVLREANRLTHNLQLPRLRSGLLAQIEIPIANGSYESVLGELDSIRDRVVSLAEHARARATHVAALEKSILNHAFAGKL